MSNSKEYIEHSADGRLATVSAWDLDDDDYPMTWNISYLNSSFSEIVSTYDLLHKFEGVETLVAKQNPHRRG